MSEGPKRTGERATMGLRHGECIEIEVKTPGVVRFRLRGHRATVQVEAPAGSSITRPVVDIRNQDDLES